MYTYVSGQAVFVSLLCLYVYFALPHLVSSEAFRVQFVCSDSLFYFTPVSKEEEAKWIAGNVKDGFSSIRNTKCIS